jgi:hypothetical protein
MTAPSELPERVRKTAVALMRWLRASHVDGVLIGGVAVSLLAEPRFTKDVDAVVWLDESQWDWFLARGSRFGFVPRINNALDFARQNRVLLLKHEPTDTTVDVSFAGLPFEREAISRAVSVRLGRVGVQLAAPENLIIMKAIAHRARDWADIEALLTAFPDVDLERIRAWVREFADVLEAPEIVDDLERVIDRWRSRRGT